MAPLSHEQLSTTGGVFAGARDFIFRACFEISQWRLAISGNGVGF